MTAPFFLRTSKIKMQKCSIYSHAVKAPSTTKILLHTNNGNMSTALLGKSFAPSDENCNTFAHSLVGVKKVLWVFENKRRNKGSDAKCMQEKIGEK